MSAPAERFQRAIALIDAANRQDPNCESDDSGEALAKELLYAQRMSAMLDRFAPEADAAVRLAVRAQHIERWKIPRADYPMNRAGYHHWRTTLYGFHAERAATLLREAGYDEATIARVASMLRKKNLSGDPGAQTMEDIAGLVFIESYLSAFAAKHPEYDEAKWIGIITKTWRKLSPRAHAFALSSLHLPAALMPLITRAITHEHHVTPQPE